MFLTNHLLRYDDSPNSQIWFNTLTGAIDRLTRQDIDAVDRSAFDQMTGIESPLLGKLVARGYLFPDEKAEGTAFHGMVDQHVDAASRGSTSLILCPTYACNLRCVYCFERQQPSGLPRVSMDVNKAKQALAAFARIRALMPGPQYSMGLFGGEPLLPSTRKVVSRALADAEAESLPVAIVTNGVNIPLFLSLFKRYHRTIKSVQLTIDGPPPVHDRRRPTVAGNGTFARVAEAADHLLVAGINVSMRVNIDSGNVGRLPELTRIATERGWTEHPSCSFNLAPVKDHLESGAVPGRTPEAQLLSALLDVYDAESETEELFGFKGFQLIGPVAAMARSQTLNMPRVFHCEANYGGFWVAGPDGFLYGCPEAIGRPDLAIGRFSDRLEIWDDQRDKWTGRNIASLIECSECALGPVCGGGCAYSSLARHGDSRPVCEAGLKEAIGIFLKRRVIPSTLLL